MPENTLQTRRRALKLYRTLRLALQLLQRSCQHCISHPATTISPAVTTIFSTFILMSSLIHKATMFDTYLASWSHLKW